MAPAKELGLVDQLVDAPDDAAFLAKVLDHARTFCPPNKASMSVGLIKRAQTVYGRVFTVSGVVCAFRKRALAAAGWWSPAVLTDDVEVTWRIRLAGRQVAFEAKALCWLLQTLTAVVGLPLALMRSKQARGTWISPDRGIR